MGFFFVVAVGMVCTASAGGLGADLMSYERQANRALWNVPFHEVSSSLWPVWHAMALVSDVNKGAWYIPGDRKYKRLCSDWDLRSDCESVVTYSAM